MRHRFQKTDHTEVVVVFIVVTAIIGFGIWWGLNYKCTSSHKEWQTHCDTVNNHTTCNTYQIDVCDEWESR